jgi:hypothetical protein
VEQLSFSLPLIDPSSGRSFEVRFWGHTDPGQAAAVQAAVQSVISARLARNELALPTLSPSLPHLTPEIAQLARVSSLALEAAVPHEAIAPAAAAIAAAPTVMESVGNTFANRAAEHAASHVPTGVRVDVGGFKVKVGKDGVDGGSLVDQIKDKAFDKLLGCAIVGGVVVLLGVITMGVLVKVLFFA